ncbi:MAG TPA: cytochrome c nitrite reductase small subunit [Anaerolineales bacterium]|nr:cytochrome c nitrite reductase small subunit [Anaerolineales bacterium]
MSRLPFFVAITAAVVALGFFAFVTDAPAYSGSAPETCANCHVMDSQYENWYHAAHEHVTECVDCHLPHQNKVVYYLEKGRQGAKDVYAFTTGNSPVAIRASEKTKDIIQTNCLRCHEDTVESVTMGAQPFDRNCWDCHRDVSHGTRGISGVPYQDAVLYPVK